MQISSPSHILLTSHTSPHNSLPLLTPHTSLSLAPPPHHTPRRTSPPSQTAPPPPSRPSSTTSPLLTPPSPFTPPSHAGLLRRHRLHCHRPAGLHQRPRPGARLVPLVHLHHLLLRLHRRRQQEEEPQGGCVQDDVLQASCPLLPTLMCGPLFSPCLSAVPSTCSPFYPPSFSFSIPPSSHPLPLNPSPPSPSLFPPPTSRKLSQFSATVANPCDQPRIQLAISIQVPTSTTINTWVSQTSQKMFDTYGRNRLCLGAHSTASQVEVRACCGCGMFAWRGWGRCEMMEVTPLPFRSLSSHTLAHSGSLAH
jgi:hypothetical protein